VPTIVGSRFVLSRLCSRQGGIPAFIVFSWVRLSILIGTPGLYKHHSKMSSSKKMTCKGNLRQVFICLSYTTTPLVTYCIRTCTYSCREWGGVGESLTREKVRWATVTHSWVENTIMIECISSL
jgi:hypothetical protein